MRFVILSFLILRALFCYGVSPLDPLTSPEIELALAIAKKEGKITDDALIPLLGLDEPDKSKVLNWNPKETYPRKALMVVLDWKDNKTYEGVINLTTKTIDSWKQITSGQANLTKYEMTDVLDQIVKDDARFKDALAKRGIDNLQDVIFTAYAGGPFLSEDQRQKRMMRVVPYYKGNYTNFYAHPIEGMLILIDLNSRKVEEFKDYEIVPFSRQNGDYDQKNEVVTRNPLKPTRMTQPEESNISVNGHQVNWYRWQFNVGIEPKEGLVIYQVSYDGRPVLYRASVAEMSVPYGDPEVNWRWRSSLDMSEYGLGKMVSSLVKGSDTPENAILLDAVVADDFGLPQTIKNAISLSEKDNGILWRHADEFSRKVESRRSQALLLQCIVRIGNIDYGFNWLFHPDGVLEQQTELYGVMLAKGTLANSPKDQFSQQVGENVSAVNNQHFFNYRLDLDIDGTANSISEINIESLSENGNGPGKNSFTAKEILLTKEKEAMRMLNFSASRKWKIFNPNKKNALGEFVSYLFIPGENTPPYLSPNSEMYQQAKFLKYNLWVTPYRPHQLYASGNYPSQNLEDIGLIKWTRQNESIVNTDLVLWYTYGITRIPRDEEWPIMNTYRTGFKLVPSNFFDKNPTLDFGS